MSEILEMNSTGPVCLMINREYIQMTVNELNVD